MLPIAAHAHANDWIDDRQHCRSAARDDGLGTGNQAHGGVAETCGSSLATAALCHPPTRSIACAANSLRSRSRSSRSRPLGCGGDSDRARIAWPRLRSRLRHGSTLSRRLHRRGRGHAPFAELSGGHAAHSLSHTSSSSLRNAPQSGQRWIAGSFAGGANACSVAHSGQAPPSSSTSLCWR